MLLAVLTANTVMAQADFRQSTNGPSRGTIQSIAINSSDDIFVGSFGWGVYRSTDNGDTWNQFTTGLPLGVNPMQTRGGVRAFSINSNGDIFAGFAGFFNDEKSGVFRSSDNGETWSDVGNGLPGFGCCTFVVDSKNDIFAGSRSGTLNNVPFFGRAFVSRDNGDNWMEISSGLDSVDITSLAVNSKDVLFAGLGEGFVIRSVESTTSVEEISMTIPSSFRLEQNYPNPFNPTTTIIYSLSVGAKVKLTIYNLNGQKVITLVNKEHQPGAYLVQWNGKDESGTKVGSGVYTYRLEAKERTETRKLVLIR